MSSLPSSLLASVLLGRVRVKEEEDRRWSPSTWLEEEITDSSINGPSNRPKWAFDRACVMPSIKRAFFQK